MNNQPLTPEKVTMLTTPRKGHSGRDIGIYAILILLVVGEVHLLRRINEIRGYVNQRDSQVQTHLQTGFEQKLATVNAKQSKGLASATERIERRFLQVEGTTRSAQSDANQAAQQIEQMQAAEDAALLSIQQMLAQKASASEVGALSNQFAQARADIDLAGAKVELLREQVGQLQATTQDQIAGLNGQLASIRRQSPRFFQFRLARNRPQTIDGVAMLLTKTRPKNGHFDMRLMIGNAHLERKNAAAGEPIVFVPGNPQQTYEVIVNQVSRDEVRGSLGMSGGVGRLISER